MRSTKSVWASWQEFATRLQQAPAVAVLSDFDGTLAPIARRPERAVLPSPTRAALRRLSGRPSVVVGVVSGRSLHDVEQRTGLGGIYYIGSHGFEWREPGGERRSRVSPRTARRIASLAGKLEAELADLGGVVIERKTTGVAVHYRNASPAAARRASRTVLRLQRQLGRTVRLLKGKMVSELLPPGRTDKGTAVTKFAAQWRKQRGRGALLLYLGDDLTDESVFRKLPRDAVGIHVGRNTRSSAAYRLRSPGDVRRFLERLAEVVK